MISSKLKEREGNYRQLRTTAMLNDIDIQRLRSHFGIRRRRIYYSSLRRMRLARNVIQNWQTPEVNVDCYDLDLYTCAWIDKLKSANRWKYQSHEHPRRCNGIHSGGPLRRIQTPRLSRTIPRTSNKSLLFQSPHQCLDVP